jgi:hypothetical protein
VNENVGIKLKYAHVEWKASATKDVKSNTEQINQSVTIVLE